MDEKMKALKALLDEIRTTFNTYVGARYVPRFTGLYDVTQSYEALDVVDNGSGTSYIAKKPTPAGTPLTDTDYWFLYGSTSGAIVNLQQQINDMKDGDVPGSLQDQIDNNTSDITALTTKIYDPSTLAMFKNKSVCIVGDSISDETTQQPNWVDVFTEIVESVGATVNNVSVSGSSIVGWGNNPTNIPQGADIYIVALGINDFQGQFTQTALLTAIQAIVSRIDLSEPTRRAFYISPLKAFIPTFTNMYTSQAVYRHFFESVFSRYGFQIIAGGCFPNLSAATNGTYIAPDNIHPKSVFGAIYAEHVIKCMLSGVSENSLFYSYVKSCTIDSGLTYGSGNVILSWIDPQHFIITTNLGDVSLTALTWTDICDIANGASAGLATSLDSSIAITYDDKIYQGRISNGKLQIAAPTTGTHQLYLTYKGSLSINPSMV